MCGKEREGCQSQLVDSGYYVEYGAENELERNYSRQRDAVMRPPIKERIIPASEEL